MKLNFFWIYFICLLFGGCKNVDTADSMILQIGTYRLTVADLLSKLKNEAYRSLSDEELMRRLIEEGQILAYAQEHSYDTIRTLHKLLDYASRTYASRVDGFVWNKKVKPLLQIGEEQLRKAYAQMGNEYIFEIVELADSSLLQRHACLLANFELLRDRALTDKSLGVFTVRTQFPYRPFDRYAEQISNANQGDIVGPFETQDGYFLAQVISVRQIEQKSYAEEKEALQVELMACLRDKFIFENQKRILTEAAPRINEAAVRELAAKKINAKQQRWDMINSKLLLMEYTHQGQRIPFYMSDFNTFITNTPVFFGSLSEPRDIKNLLRSYIVEEDLVAEAQRMKMLSDSAYLQFRKMYQEMLFVNHYKRQHLAEIPNIFPDAIREYYYENAHLFKAFEKAKVDIYTFVDGREAMKARGILTDLNSSAVRSYKTQNSALSQPTRMEIRANDPKSSYQLLKTIVSLDEGQISYPIELNGQFVLIAVREKSGEDQIPLRLASADVKQLLQTEKEKQVLETAIANLERMYPVKSNRIAEILPQLKVASGVNDPKLTPYVSKK